MKTYLVLYCDTAIVGLPFRVWQVQADSFAQAIRMWDKNKEETWKAYQITMI